MSLHKLNFEPTGVFGFTAQEVQDVISRFQDNIKNQPFFGNFESAGRHYLLSAIPSQEFAGFLEVKVTVDGKNLAPIFIEQNKNLVYSVLDLEHTNTSDLEVSDTVQYLRQRMTEEPQILPSPANNDLEQLRDDVAKLQDSTHQRASTTLRGVFVLADKNDKEVSEVIFALSELERQGITPNFNDGVESIPLAA